MRRVARESLTYLHCNRVGAPEYIGCSEAEQAESGADKAILAAVVINQPITVVAAVVLDGQALKAIKQVWTAQEPALIVINRKLDLRPRKSGEHEEHPWAGLHCGLGAGLGQLDDAPQARDALGAGVALREELNLIKPHYLQV